MDTILGAEHIYKWGSLSTTVLWTEYRLPMETCEKQISDTVLDVEHTHVLIISNSKYSRNGNILLFESFRPFKFSCCLAIKTILEYQTKLALLACLLMTARFSLAWFMSISSVLGFSTWRFSLKPFFTLRSAYVL